MKIINKLFLLGAILLGLAACSNDDIVPTQDNDVKGDTHVGVTLTMALPNSNNISRSTNHNFNHIGQWAGQDIIESIAIYIVDGTTVSTGQFRKGDFNIVPTEDNNGRTISISPKKAIKTTPGEKKVYALINATKEIEKQLAKSDAVGFEKAYTEVALKLENSVEDSNVSTSASKLAVIKENNDRITMTNAAESTLLVEEKVSEEQALSKSEPKNRAKVSVQRTVARVLVTKTQDSYKIKNNGQEIGEVSDIKWVLAQGENSVYVQNKSDYATPAFSFIPNSGDYKLANDHYDYSGLKEDHNSEKEINGTPVTKLSTYALLNENKDNQEEVLQSLGLKVGDVQGKFLLPNTHKYGEDQSSTGYRKGNTAYVLVRAKFTPASLADGEEYVAGEDFYMGANGLFYSSKENAHSADKGGVENQKVSRYINGKVLYYAWVNPDKVPGWINSPVRRNNIYHVQITGFKTIGTNWNPLVPTDPEDPNNPNFPENPDPKPTDPSNPGQPDPDEPENPIDPEDPLTVKETWMSVEVGVLPWEVHSYQVELGI